MTKPNGEPFWPCDRCGHYHSPEHSPCRESDPITPQELIDKVKAAGGVIVENEKDLLNELERP